MYAQEFAPADAVFEPVQDGLVLGLPAVMLAAFVALLVVAGVVGWLIGRRPSRAANSAAASIWKAVDDAVRSAMTAHSDGLADRARTLKRTIEDRLGKTLVLAGGLAPLAELDSALDDTPHHHNGHDGHDAHSPATGSHDDPAAEPEHVTPATAGVVIERAGRVVIHQPAPPRDDRRPVPPSRPTPDWTQAQKRDAIRKAVSDFNDHWRLKDARIAEIEAAHRELSAPRR